MALPSSGTRLQYIESSGKQYFSTGIVPDKNTRFVMDFQILESQTSSGYVFGARETGVGFFWLLFDGSVFSTRYGSQSAKSFSSSINAYSRLTVDKNSNVTTLGGETVTHNAETWSTSLSMNLFADNQNGEAKLFSHVRSWGCEIYQNGVLVREYIPWLTEDGVAGMYETEEGVFKPSEGSAAFIAGPPYDPNYIEPAEGHNALIDGTTYAITGGEVLVNGTVYDIGGGKTLVGGTVYEILFKPSKITVKITGTGNSTYCYAKINETKYTSATTLEIEPETEISVTVGGSSAIGNMKSYVYLNGVQVAKGANSRATYTFMPDCSVVNIELVGSGNGSTVNITTS